ncbi:hypothetical protein MKW92_037282 [Papaver armeniacum]|nr:hypothetical protein MKW92_037282 [Papaver armeniacum]
MSEFGAEQVILVRDDSVRKEIAEHNGKQALVLTIADCKGLEFQLLDEGNFEMATMCFERAGDSFLEKLAKASGLRVAGVHMLSSNTELARVALVEAAEIYESIGKADFVVKCSMELKDLKRADGNRYSL